MVMVTTGDDDRIGKVSSLPGGGGGKKEEKKAGGGREREQNPNCHLYTALTLYRPKLALKSALLT